MFTFFFGNNSLDWNVISEKKEKLFPLICAAAIQIENIKKINSLSFYKNQ